MLLLLSVALILFCLSVYLRRRRHSKRREEAQEEKYSGARATLLLPPVVCCTFFFLIFCLLCCRVLCVGVCFMGVKLCLVLDMDLYCIEVGNIYNCRRCQALFSFFLFSFQRTKWNGMGWCRATRPLHKPGQDPWYETFSIDRLVRNV